MAWSHFDEQLKRLAMLAIAAFSPNSTKYDRLASNKKD
jgi:hypothetical protein